MDDIQMRCPKCGQKLEVSTEYIGQRVDCPTCGNPIDILPSVKNGSLPALEKFPDLSAFPWWLQPWFMVGGTLLLLLPCLLWLPFVLFPLAFGGVLVGIRFWRERGRIQSLTETLTHLLKRAARAKELEEFCARVGYATYEEVQGQIEIAQAKIAAIRTETQTATLEMMAAQSRRAEMDESLAKAWQAVESVAKKTMQAKEIYRSIKNAIDRWLVYEPQVDSCKIPAVDLEAAESLAPSVELLLPSMGIKDLRKAARENEKRMELLFSGYAGRYTSKANKTIYSLVVIALRSELQAILSNLKYGSLEEATSSVKKVIEKAIFIAGSGNQSILPTLTKFIGQIEYHFNEAIKIEYLYYLRKEQAKQEQIALREQMRQDAAERKALEEQQKRIDEEEEKYKGELERLAMIQSTASAEEVADIEARILEVKIHMNEVAVKRDEIASLRKGKAGTVYIISNLGSFGEDVFKIGMTRRLDPQDRVDELGDASVPFEFDVHCFIFSKDAVSLESKLHDVFASNRLNKVNKRKEFFRTNMDTLEQTVQEIEPTAQFNRTMLAEEYRASVGNITLNEEAKPKQDAEEDGEQNPLSD